MFCSANDESFEDYTKGNGFRRMVFEKVFNVIGIYFSLEGRKVTNETLCPFIVGCIKVLDVEDLSGYLFSRKCTNPWFIVAVENSAEVSWYDLVV